jgi:UDP-perosamine 4-acetyltransferase
MSHRAPRLDGVVVIGAGGHAKVLISTLTACGVSVAAVVDDDDTKRAWTLKAPE